MIYTLIILLLLLLLHLIQFILYTYILCSLFHFTQNCIKQTFNKGLSSLFCFRLTQLIHGFRKKNSSEYQFTILTYFRKKKILNWNTCNGVFHKFSYNNIKHTWIFMKNKNSYSLDKENNDVVIFEKHNAFNWKKSETTAESPVILFYLYLFSQWTLSYKTEFGQSKTTNFYDVFYFCPFDIRDNTNV